MSTCKKEILKIRGKLIIIFVLFLYVTGCSPNVEQVKETMLASEKGSFVLYVFWDVPTDYVKLTEEMVSIINDEAVLQNDLIQIENMTFVSLSDSSQEYDYQNLFNIQSDLYVLVFDHMDLVFETAQLEELVDFLNKDSQKHPTKQYTSIELAKEVGIGEKVIIHPIHITQEV